MGLENNYLLYAFVIIGLILIIFPNEMGIAAPYILGGVLLLYGILNIIVSVKYRKSFVSQGKIVISIVTGGVLLFQRGDSVSILGVVWAMISLYEAAKEIDEYRHEKKVSLISLIWIIISIGLAVLLMINPFAHFYTHVRILGIEIIVYVLEKEINKRKNRKNKAE